MVKQFTQDEINKISGVYKKKYGGDENAFRADIEKQYGTGAFDTVKSAMKGVYEAYKSQTPAVNAAAKIAQKNLGVTAEEANKIAEKTYGNVAGTNTTQTPGGILPPKGESSYVVGTEPASSVTPVNTSAIKTSEDAAQAVTDATKANIDATSQAATDYQNAMNVRTEEDKKLAEEQKAQAEAEAAKKEAVYIETDKKVADLENQLSKLIEERKTRDVADLEAKKQSEVDKLNADQELQKWKDEQSVKKAEQQVETEKLKASFAFNRLGLGFSSYAVGTVNRIATEGATAIAGLKLQASANQATFAKDVANLEFNYTKEINQTIDVYTDKSIALKEASIKRIKELELNILATDKEKNDAIRDITKEYLANKRENEDKAYREFERLRDKQLDQARELQAQMAAQEKIQIAKGEMMIANGSWLKMTPAQKAEYENKAGLPVGTLDAQMNTNINTLITNVLDRVMGQGFLLPNRDAVTLDIQKEMRNGRDLASATTIVMERVLKNNTDYIAKQNQIKEEQRLKSATTTSALSSMGINDFSSLYTGSNGPAFANNNPGNIKDTSFGGSHGGKGGFTKFSTIEDGMNALVEKIKFNQSNGVGGVNNGSKYNGNMTLTEYFNKYAPASDGNNPASYAATVAKNLGINVNTKIKDVDANKFATEIARHENGGVYNEMVKRGLIQDGVYIIGNSGRYTNDDMMGKSWYTSFSEAEKKTFLSMSREQQDAVIKEREQKASISGISQEEKERIDIAAGGVKLTPEQYKSAAGKSNSDIQKTYGYSSLNGYTDANKLSAGQQELYAEIVADISDQRNNMDIGFSGITKEDIAPIVQGMKDKGLDNGTITKILQDNFPEQKGGAPNKAFYVKNGKIILTGGFYGTTDEVNISDLLNTKK